MKENEIITEQDFLKAEDEYFELTDEALQELAISSSQEQPALFTFAYVYSEGLEEEDNQDFFMQLVFITWIAYSDKYELKKVLTIAEIEKMDEDEEKHLSAIENNEDELLNEVLQKLTTHPQPELIELLYKLIADFFEIDDPEVEKGNREVSNDVGIIMGAMTLFVSFMEKIRDTNDLTTNN